MPTNNPTEPLGNHTLSVPSNFWNILSQDIFSRGEKSIRMSLFKPSMSLANVQPAKYTPSDKLSSAKSFFRSRRSSKTRVPGITVGRGSKLGSKLRKRSVDLLTDKSTNQLMRFVKPPSLIKQELHQDQPKLGRPAINSIQTTKENKTGYPKSRLTFDCSMSKRKSSIMLPAMRRDKPIEKTIVIQRSFDEQGNRVDELTLAYLWRTLSSMLTDSVYLKDIFRVFKSFNVKPVKAYQYRSRSADRSEDQLSTRKRRIFDKCLFQDYLHNIYLHFSLLKQSITRNSYMMDKNTILFSELDKKNQKPVQPGDPQEKTRKHFVFNFLTVIKLLKEFVFAIKHMNKTGRLKYIEVQYVHQPKYRVDKLKLTSGNNSQLTPVVLDSQIISQPIHNLKSVNLFQKLVQHTVIAEKHLIKQKEIRSKIKNCLKKSFFFIRRDAGKKRVLENAVSSFKSKSVGVTRMFVDVNAMFKMPRTIQPPKITPSLKSDIKTVAKNFRLKNFNFKLQDTVSPYTMKPKLNNYDL